MVRSRSSAVANSIATGKGSIATGKGSIATGKGSMLF